MVKIPVDSILTFTRDPEVKCKVISSKKIELNNEETSLSAAASKALEGVGVFWKSVQGPQYWEYEGETLIERRHRLEQGE